MSLDYLNQCSLQCGKCKEAWNWREEEATRERVGRVKYSICGGKDVVVGGRVGRNKKEEVFCPPCRIEKKVPWWNWGSKIQWSVPRAQKERAGIIDLEKR